MNFFEAQDRSRRAARWLIVVYVLAALAIVVGVTAIVGFAFFITDAGYDANDFVARQTGLLVSTAVITLAFIVGATLFKTAALASGGGQVARDLGGTLVPSDVQDPLRQRLRNVVEEMAIASGVAVPEVYVLEEEPGINAFAAGFAPEDAAIAVTRGALEILDRDELQGVIAHEFSHILNGDMRLNIRMMGVLFGIMVLGMIGRMVLRARHYGSYSSGRAGRRTASILLIGFGLAVLGSVGVFCARLIKAGVSRQREILADASAVQFTRQTSGLAGALKKIGGYTQGSYLQAADPEEVSHMLFGSGAGLSGLLATHPPLLERIRALDPSFEERDFPRVEPDKASVTEADPRDTVTGLAAPVIMATAASIAENVAAPRPEQVDYASKLRQSIPSELYDAAHSPELALLLVLSLLVDRNDRLAQKQLTLLDEQLGTARARLVRQYADLLIETGPAYRLPLLEIALPALRRRPLGHRNYLIDLARRMIEVDNEVDLYEFCFFRLLVFSLEQAEAPSRPTRRVRASRASLRAAAIDLLHIVACYGHGDPQTANAAFEAGSEKLGDWVAGITPVKDMEVTPATLDKTLDELTALNPKSRSRLVEAVGAVVMFDRRLTVEEAELLRAICATLQCPLPPLGAI